MGLIPHQGVLRALGVERHKNEAVPPLLRHLINQVNVVTPVAAYELTQSKITRTKQPGRGGPKSRQPEFTIDRECDGGNCHFEIVSFRYGRNLIISVGSGDTSLSYYFSVGITKDKITKEYVYTDQPNEHFTKKGSGQRVDPELNKALLDVYRLGQYVMESNIPIRNRKFSETERFAVLANLRSYF